MIQLFYTNRDGASVIKTIHNQEQAGRMFRWLHGRKLEARLEWNGEVIGRVTQLLDGSWVRWYDGDVFTFPKEAV